MLKNTKKSFIFLLLLSLTILRCGGGSGDGSADSGRATGETTEGEITLAWDSGSDPSIAGYKIYYGRVSKAVSGQYEHSIDVGMATPISNKTISHRLARLTKGQKYYIAVTAYDKSHMESDFSNEVSGAAQPVKR